MHNIYKLIIIIIFFFGLNIRSFGRTYSENFKSFELLSGYGQNKISGAENYDVIPLFTEFNFDLKFLHRNTQIKPKVLFHFMIEPFISIINSPQDSIELGNNFGIKINFFTEKNFQPYIKGGIGVIYLSRRFEGQSTNLNFTEYAASGLQYFINKNNAISVEYRYRHISNCGIRHPNNGIGSDFILCGFSFIF